MVIYLITIFKPLNIVICMLIRQQRTNHNAVYKLNLLVIRSYNLHDRPQIYRKSNSARNHTINEITLANR